MDASLGPFHSRRRGPKVHHGDPYSSGVATTPSLQLVGRDRELARLEDFVGRLREGPRAVLVRGEPGIGKTALWREVVAAAGREGVQVLVSRCGQAEMPISFGALADLVDPVYEEVAEAIAEPQRRALAAALRVEGDEHERPDRLALPRALVATLQALAAADPVLVAVDDVQWLDAPSARALAYAARRVGASPIGVLRCRASLLLAREQADEATTAARAAAEAFAELGFPLDRARSLLTAGAAMRRAGQRRLAADSLRGALEIFEEVGAVLWQQRAEEELRRASPRPRQDRDLTSAERRVAALVAQGLTNREVAAQLFTTVTTVEAHLTRIYRKLDIRSRTQLARAVADGSLDLES